jgi:hypothetical protein
MQSRKPHICWLFDVFDLVRYFDLYHGTVLKAQHDPTGRTVLSFPVEAHGYGAVLGLKPL